jgi:two-component system response regulator HydG
MESVLIIDDDSDLCHMLSQFLEKKGYTCGFALSGHQGLKMLKASPYDICIVDFRLPDTDGLELLQKIKAGHPDIAVIIITGYSDIRNAVNSMKYGAVDYIAKPLQPDELLSVIKKAGKEVVAEQASRQPERAASAERAYILGRNHEAQKIFTNISLVAPTNLAVIIQGETGTGKEFVAREIHTLSHRNTKPFVAVDCGALSETLANSEFFGHEKGSFTDAIGEKDGSFKLADGGTLFLDEIGNLSYDVQVKLLRALQEKKVRRVGGVRDINIDVRIIVASNEDLRKAVKEGRFREDLFHRLNEFSIHVPPIRERKEDIPEFVDHFLKLANIEFNKSVETISDNVQHAFLAYHWPGNLRELKNVIRRSVLLCEGHLLTEDCLPEELVDDASVKVSGDEPHDLKYSSMLAEKQAIEEALVKTGFNKTEAARLLNIDRKTLYNKFKSYNIPYKKS